MLENIIHHIFNIFSNANNASEKYGTFLNIFYARA